jgi:hypothetical protein
MAAQSMMACGTVLRSTAQRVIACHEIWVGAGLAAPVASAISPSSCEVMEHQSAIPAPSVVSFLGEINLLYV